MNQMHPFYFVVDCQNQNHQFQNHHQFIKTQTNKIMARVKAHGISGQVKGAKQKRLTSMQGYERVEYSTRML